MDKQPAANKNILCTWQRKRRGGQSNNRGSYDPVLKCVLGHAQVKFADNTGFLRSFSHSFLVHNNRDNVSDKC